MTNALRYARTWALAAVLLCLPPLGTAAEPVIVAPTEPVPIGGFCDVTITGLADKDKLAWVTVPEIPVRVYAVWGSGDPILSVPTNKSGTWTLVLGFTDEAGKPVLHKVLLTIGAGPGPGPGPEPEPDPPVPPDPTPVPGPRTVWIVYEGAETTVALGQLLTQIRQPPYSQYLLDNGHALAIVDDDIVDENGRPPATVTALQPHIAGMTLPVLLIADKATNKLVHKQELPANATPASVLEIVKEHD